MKQPVVAVFLEPQSSAGMFRSVVRPLQLSGKYRIVPVYRMAEGRMYADLRSDLMAVDGADVSRLRAVYLRTDVDKMFIELAGRRRKPIAVDAVFGASGCGLGQLGPSAELSASYVNGAALAGGMVGRRLLLQTGGLPVRRFETVLAADFRHDDDAVVTHVNRKLHYPLIVEGIPDGPRPIAAPESLRSLLGAALEQEHYLIVSETTDGAVEYLVSVLGGGGMPHVARLADSIPEALRPSVQEACVRAYQILGCRGLISVIVSIRKGSGTFHIEDVVPADIGHSIPSWNLSGVSAVELVDGLVESVLARQPGAVALRHG